MFSDNFFVSMLGHLARIVPTILVCGIGIIVLQTRVIPRKTKTLAVLGLLLMIIDQLVAVTFSMYLSSGGIDYSSQNFQLLQISYGVIAQVLHAVALVLLIIAICNKDLAATKKETPENPYQ
jgi:uncharacterized membrane protein